MPTTAVMTVSALGMAAASNRPSIPDSTRTLVSASRTRRSAAAFSSISTASSGLNCRACSSIRSTLELAVKAATLMPQAAITSNDCRPMEPVEPKIEIRLLILFTFLVVDSFLESKESKELWRKTPFCFPFHHMVPKYNANQNSIRLNTLFLPTKMELY